MPEFGRRLGCSRDVIANIEYGRVEPKEVLMDHMCEIYRVNREWLYHGQGPMFSEEAPTETTMEAISLFRTLSPDLQELALSQLRSLQKLMEKKKQTKSGEMRENLDTIRLMAAMLKADEFGSWHENANEGGLTGIQIQKLMEEKNMTTEQLAKRSNLKASELENILNQKGEIRRDALISIGLALTLGVEETQRLLTMASLPALYAKNRRDAACMFALMKGLTIKGLNELLVGLDEFRL